MTKGNSEENDKKKRVRLMASSLMVIGLFILLTGFYEYYLLKEWSRTALVGGLFNMLIGFYLLRRNR